MAPWPAKRVGGRARVSGVGHLTQVQPPPGWVLGKLMMLIAGDRIVKGTLNEFKHFAETGKAAS